MNNKRKYFATSAILGLCLVLGLPAAYAETPLEGAWIVSSWDKLGDQAIADAQPGIFIFTSTNYSIMFANTAEARPEYDGDAGMTDEEKRSAYDSLTANSGGYEVDGNKFTTYAYVAKDTNYMAGFPENGVEYEFVRDGDMLTITSLSFAVEIKVVLERVEGKDGPWKTE